MDLETLETTDVTTLSGNIQSLPPENTEKNTAQRKTENASDGERKPVRKAVGGFYPSTFGIRFEEEAIQWD